MRNIEKSFPCALQFKIAAKVCQVHRVELMPYAVFQLHSGQLFPARSSGKKRRRDSCSLLEVLAMRLYPCPEKSCKLYLGYLESNVSIRQAFLLTRFDHRHRSMFSLQETDTEVMTRRLPKRVVCLWGSTQSLRRARCQ